VRSDGDLAVLQHSAVEVTDMPGQAGRDRQVQHLVEVAVVQQPTLTRLRHITPAAAAGLNACTSFSMYRSWLPDRSKKCRKREIGMFVMVYRCEKAMP